jgi:hypothetical protein
MTFTYTTPFVTDTDRLRFKIQDTVAGSGIRPDGGNFSDEELASVLLDAGSVSLATGVLYEALASEWARYVNTTIGPRREELSQIATHYRNLASQWRADYGKTDSGSSITTGFATRKDGYSQDIDSGRD